MKQWIRTNLKGDPSIWGLTFLLAILSILVVYSATSSLAYRQMKGNTEYYLIKHTSLMLASLVAMWVTHRIDYRYYTGLAKLGLWLSVPLLLITWRYGLTLNEASRWLNIPVINKAFQPSDLAQLSLIIRVSSILAKYQSNIADFKQALKPILTWCGTICGLIALTNFSGALLLFLTCMLLMYLGRIPLKYLAMLSITGLLAATIAIGLGQRGLTAYHRLQTFFRQNDLPFQTKQAYIAIAAGGLYGKGPGNSTQRNFLPHPYSDFIYAILLEEYGFLGGVVVMLLYLVLLYRGIHNIGSSSQPYGGLLSAGLSFALVLQAMVNMGVAVGLGPVTGLPLPFVSMGGTALLFTGISLGIILSVSRGEIDPSIDLLTQQPELQKPINSYKNSMQL
jgi:cell division protein FtsW